MAEQPNFYYTGEHFDLSHDLPSDDEYAARGIRKHTDSVWVLHFLNGKRCIDDKISVVAYDWASYENIY